MTCVQEQATRPINLQRGVRQGDAISPKLFTAAFEDFLKLLDSNEYEINMNTDYITDLRFADDIVVMAETLVDLNSTLNDRRKFSPQGGLTIKIRGTKIVWNKYCITKLVWPLRCDQCLSCALRLRAFTHK